MCRDGWKQHYICSLGTRLLTGCNRCIICILGSLLPAIKDPIVLSWELKTIYTLCGRSEGLNDSADSSQPLLWEPLQLDSQGVAYGGLQEVAPTAQEKNKTKNNEVCSGRCTSFSYYWFKHTKSVCLNLGNFVVHPDKQNPDRYTKLKPGNSFSIRRAVENLALLADKTSSASKFIFNTKQDEGIF